MHRLEFRKYDINSRTPSVVLSRDDNKVLSLLFGGNLDLYITLRNYGNDPTFVISKDNYAVYEIFDTLYNDIKNCNLYSFDDVEISFLKTECELFDLNFDKKLKNRMKEIQESNHFYKQMPFYKELFDGTVVRWSSDEYPKEIAPLFEIRKDTDSYIFIFKYIEPGIVKEMKEFESYYDYFFNHFEYSIPVRLRNDGSRYTPFNILFMRAFNELKKLDETYEQVHIEEYMLEKKKTLKKY